MVVLGDMVAVDPGGVGLRHQLQALFVLLGQIAVVPPLQVVEDSELHQTTPRLRCIFRKRLQSRSQYHG
ncbi:MAG: hypothetical protein ACHP7N_14165 [Caulobacterales bacterium]